MALRTHTSQRLQASSQLNNRSPQNISKSLEIDSVRTAWRQLHSLFHEYR